MMYTFLTFIKKAKISEINVISCSCPKNNTGYGILEKKIYWILGFAKNLFGILGVRSPI